MKNDKFKMTQHQLLTAELFDYSYDNYADHLEVGNARFKKIMPEFCATLGEAIDNKLPKEKIAQRLKIDPDKVDSWIKSYKDSAEIVNAVNPSEAFRISLQKIMYGKMKENLDTKEKIDDLIIQICYRVADLGYLLELEKSELSDYSDWLRRDKDVDYSMMGLPNLE